MRCQDGRSQQKNKEKALSILRSRLLEEKQREEEAKYSAHRKSQIGTGGREEKIRTYNFPQNRITDHRIGLTLYNLDRVMEGDLDEMIQPSSRRFGGAAQGIRLGLTSGDAVSLSSHPPQEVRDSQTTCDAVFTK